MKLPDKVYDILKWVVMIGLPAILVFLNTVLPASGVPAETVNLIATWVSAVTVLIGSLIGLSTANYNKK